MIAGQDWARCKKWIEAAAVRAPWPENISRVEEKIRAGQYQFWPGEKAAVVTEVIFYDERKLLNIVYAGGDMDELLSRIEPALCDVARTLGCGHISVHGRDGWKRACKASGYQFAWTLLLKELPLG